MTKAKSDAYERGVKAELLAEKYLMSCGYKILDRRYKTPVGEVDLVALKGDMLVMVEVKARARLEAALESITPRGQRRIEQTTQHFLMDNPEYAGHAIRFDVIAFDGSFKFKHLDNAWFAEA